MKRVWARGGVFQRSVGKWWETNSETAEQGSQLRGLMGSVRDLQEICLGLIRASPSGPRATDTWRRLTSGLRLRDVVCVVCW